MDKLKNSVVKMEPINPPEIVSPSLQEFIDAHGQQLLHSGVPRIFWSTLHHKLQHDIWDLADHVALNRVLQVSQLDDDESSDPDQQEQLSKPRVFCAGKTIECADDKNIFLVDHAWTFDLPSARKMLESFPNLLQRMCGIMEIEERDVEGQIKGVIASMWKYINTYSVNSPNLEAEDKLPRWYMMDEIGSRIGHSEQQTNCRLVPFYYIHGQITYSLLFPLIDIEQGSEISRNFLEDIRQEEQLTRQCRLLPWLDTALPDISFEPRDVPLSYFSTGTRLDSVPAICSPSASVILQEKGVLNVFSEYEVLSEFLTDTRFQLVNNQADADILWYRRHFNDFLAFSAEFPEKFTNQFPNESLLTCKDLLSIVCRRAVLPGQVAIVDRQSLESLPLWLPTTYNLENDLSNFVAYYRAREERGMDNLWICKPWNLARSLDITISSSLHCLLRLPETGPKLCSKYIEKPVLFQRDDVLDGSVKFDLRFIVMLKSVSPLRIGIYKRFWLRFANKSFSLNDLDVYDKHFTVMNYGQGPIHQMFCHDFIRHFERQNPGCTWEKVEQDLYGVIRDVFGAAVNRPPPEGLVHSPQSRAVYGLDFMLKWKPGEIADVPGIQPMLLEINFSPDCKRACDYYPDFYNDIFSYLFLDEEPVTITSL